MKNLNKHMKQVGDIKDRGTLKWQGMFLTEHVQMLRELAEEDKKMPQPKLDEYDLQLIQEEMAIGLQRKCDAIIHTWRDGEVTRHHGTIIDINTQSRILTYEDPFKKRTLNIDEIVSINLVD
ncbi:YolD-like family protein [Planomicrobium sp. CPCC 101079]|uniref:YolD-like family protein n=1 Tax=Planomicrobium sp. CPCC 101079 TaxID=2599618 RepID=UPI0011B6892A|nr:YolD-like family protein [Planomicrobium sp. CPCC 101079]TWT04585.1 YolD-like family protein [Planomicrobium sp. CPCC 101079]